MENTDRELLELAAKAAGIELFIEPASPGCQFQEGRKLFSDLQGSKEWNPLHNNGDALWLAVKLGFLEAHNNARLRRLLLEEQAHNLRDAATRRAIVRAAAEIKFEQLSCRDMDAENEIAEAVAAEREACAKVCESIILAKPARTYQKMMAQECAAAIRARSACKGGL